MSQCCYKLQTQSGRIFNVALSFFLNSLKPRHMNLLVLVNIIPPIFQGHTLLGWHQVVVESTPN